MKAAPPPPAQPATRADRLLRACAPLVPHHRRADWLREWRAELAHARLRAARAGRPTRADGVARVLGALPHAVYLRWEHWRIEMLGQDLKHAVRALVAKPAFAVAVLATLAVGIGGNAAIFAVVNAVLLRPLPFPEPDRLVQVFKTAAREPDRLAGAVTPPDFTDWRHDNVVFTELSAFSEGSYTLTGQGAAEQLPGAEVTGGFFAVLGTRPALGRVIATADDPPGARDVVVLGHGLWVRRFGGDPGIIGRSVPVDGVAREVIGVMPAGFAYPLQSELWLPLRFTAKELQTQRGAHYLDVVGRLKPGMAVARARDDLRQIAARLAAAYPATNRDQTAAVAPLRDALVQDARPGLFVLLGAVGLVLLIVCANVAHLVLIRAVGRQRELAVRVALGAGRATLVRGLVVESLVLGLGGGACGLVLAYWATGVIATLDAGAGVPLLDQTRLDGTVVALTLGLSVAAAILFGLVPAWHATSMRDMVVRVRQAGSSTTSDPRRQRMRSGLIVAETMLAVVLLVSAGLLARSFWRLVSVDLGFAVEAMQTFSVMLPDSRYPQPEQRAEFVDRLVSELAARPDVESAGAVLGLPLTNFRYALSTSTRDGVALDDETQDALTLQVRVVTPDYFRTMRMPVTRGRGFSADDRRGAAPVAVLSASAAALLWPGVDALGHQLEIGSSLGQGPSRAGGQVVGVVPDIRSLGPAAPTRPTIYLAHAQFPVDMVSVVVRARGAPDQLVGPARNALRGLDSEVPMFRVRTMAQVAAGAVAQPRLYVLLVGGFAVTAIVLAAIGLYGVLAFSVGQRTREIGIRMALGAPRAEVVRMVMGQAGRLSASGTLAGLLMAAAASRTLQSQLFEVAPTDAATYAAVASVLLAVSLLASWVPARRASRVDPLSAIRHD